MGRVRYGVHMPLEQVADELLRTSMIGETSRDAKSDILTPWKLANRLAAEIYTSSGTPDPSLRLGIFSRDRNLTKPYLNSCDGAITGHRGMLSGGTVETYEAGEED